MIYLKILALTIVYIIELFFSICLTFVAYLFCWFIALFVDTETGNLPIYLKWFQTPDATCYDIMWVAAHPTWSKYLIALTWIARNPAYGYRKWCMPTQLDTTLVINNGNVNIADGVNGIAGFYFFVNTNGYWNFSYIFNLYNGSCVQGELGWYLLPIAKKYDSVNTGMLCGDVIRFYSFGVVGN